MLRSPELLINTDKCKRNIEKMALKAKKHGLIFRPHFKTHQSLEIGRWFKAYGVEKITVSSLQMASYFSSEWNDITVAFPTNILEIERINQLAENINLNLVVESVETLGFLKHNLTNSVGIYIKVDAGYHRTGVLPDDFKKVDAILDEIDASSNINFEGFLAHSGHTYKCRNKEGVDKIHNECLETLNSLKLRYQKRYDTIILSLGDTPSCSIQDNFDGIDEIRPGNFVFYDLTQYAIGSCSIDEITVGMACPIVAIHKERNEIVVYGGGVHLSKERLENEKEGTIYGRIVKKNEKEWGELENDVYVKSLSQEHGIIKAPESFINRSKIGDYLIVLPVHSCMTANLMKGYLTSEGEKIEMMPYPYP